MVNRGSHSLVPMLATSEDGHAGPQPVATFREKAPWWGGDLQTLRNLFIAPLAELAASSSPIEFATSDGSSDRLLGRLERPNSPQAGAPLILLIHGLTGCQDSTYVQRSALFHLARGRSVVRLNLRGAGPSLTLAQGFYHAGRYQDLVDVIGGLEPEIGYAGLFAIGFSLGGNVLLNLLNALGRDHPVVGAAVVSAPIRLEVACKRIMAPRNALYHRWLLKRMQEDVLRSDRLSVEERAIIRGARSVYEFDDRWVAPRNGFRDADDYYRCTGGAQFIPDIATPTLIIHAMDDPWIPADPHTAARKSAASKVRIVVSRRGGHVGFHEQGHTETWHDRLIDAFLCDLI